MKRRSINSTEPPFCACGCGKPVKRRRNGTFNSFLLGHNSKLPDNAGEGTRWRPGQSGNPAGCKTGSRSKITRSAEAIINGEAEVLTHKLIELGMAGNVSCLLTAIKTLVPPKRSSPIRLPDLPVAKNVGELPLSTAYVLKAVSNGQLSPADAATLSNGVLSAHGKSLLIGDLESRLEVLENALFSDAGQ